MKQKPAIITTPYPTLREVVTHTGMKLSRAKKLAEIILERKLTQQEFDEWLDKRRK